MKGVGSRSVASIVAMLLVACGKEAPPKTDLPPPSAAFVSGLPAPFAETSLRAEGACSVDLINGALAGAATEVRKAGKLHVVGWGAIPRTSSVAQAVLIELAAPGRKSLYYAVAEGGIRRPDVAKALKVPAFQNAGFNLSSGLDVVPPGAYHVNVVLFDGSAGLVCFGKKKVRVK